MLCTKKITDLLEHLQKAVARRWILDQLRSEPTKVFAHCTAKDIGRLHVSKPEWNGFMVVCNISIHIHSNIL